MRLLNLLFIILLVSAVSVFAQTSTITYQGRLTDNSMAANGSYQMRFSLFDLSAGGTQSGATIEITNVPVTNGIFTVELNFGTNTFPFGENRYLQIEVRRTSGEVYTSLTPRQQVTTTPYSIRSLLSNTAENSNRLGNLDSSQYVQITDPRLSDARTPTAGSGFYVQNTTTPQTANFNVSGTGTANILNAATQFNLNNNRILSSPGTNNTFVGINTGTDLTSGFGNSFIGRDSGSNTTTGNRNTFAGSGSGFENIGGSDNSFFGFNSGLRVTNGTKNSFFGVSAGSANLVGNNNSFFGYESGLKTTTGENSFFGVNAGKENTTGSGNSFFGSQAGSKIIDGFANSFYGWLTGSESTTGSYNSFFGVQAGQRNVADFNAFFGFSSGFSNTTGVENAFFGYSAGQANNTGQSNVILGSAAGLTNTEGSFNVFVGRTAGGFNETGNANSFVGYNAGLTNVTGEANTAVGYNANMGSDNLFNATAVGAFAIVTASNTIQLGRNGVDEVRVGKLAAATSTNLCINSNNAIAACSSSRRYKENIADFRPGLSLLQKLRPVSFNWKGEGTPDFGLVAEEVFEIEPLLTTTNRDGEIQGVKYDRLGVVLINVVKEQQTQIETQTEENKQLKSKIANLENELDKQKRLVENLRLLVCADKPEAEICQTNDIDQSKYVNQP